MEKVLNLREAKEITLKDLFQIQYDTEDVLQAETDRRVRNVNLNKAATLGKSAKLHTQLVLKTIKEFVQVKGIVHFANSKGITLEHGHFIPIHAIYSVDIY